MSAGKVTVVLLFILLLVWLVLLTLGNLGIMPGSTQKYVKDRKWDKMREMLEDLYKADGTEDETVCKEIRDWWKENQDDYDDFIAEQEDGDPETLNDWSYGLPIEIEFEDFIDEYFKDVGKGMAESDFLEIAKGISLCENEVDHTELKENVVRIIKTEPPEGYDETDDCANVVAIQSVLPNYVWSYDDDTFIDISNLEDDTIKSTDWRKKHKKVCTPLAMDEEYIPASSVEGVDTPAKIKFTNVTNPISGTKIEVFEEGQGGLTTGLTHTFSSSTTMNFEIPLTAMTTFNKPLYVVKLDGKETDHVFAGNVGTIAFKETKAAVEGVAAVAGVDANNDNDYDDQGDTAPIDAILAEPAEYDYTKLEFTPNIDIPAGYEIIVEASKLPEITSPGQLNPHSCPTDVTDPKIVAKIKSETGSTIAKATTIEIPQEWCYGTPWTSTGRVTTKPTTVNIVEYVNATYKAYIRKTKTSTVATDPENPQYQFATLTKAASLST